MKYSGSGLTNGIWEIIKTYLVPEGFIIDDPNKSMNFTQNINETINAETLEEEMQHYGLQINQNGTKIRLLAYEYEEAIIPEIILTKQ